MNASGAMEIDSYLCQLLGTLSLTAQRPKPAFLVSWRKGSEEQAQTSQTQAQHVVEDTAMSTSDSSDSEDSMYLPSPSSNSASYASSCGCAYLQAIQDQIRTGRYSTTSGDYLETIFTHREALYAFPQGHRTCALGFSELARDLQEREQHGIRPDWEGDSGAVAAFTHEAWVIANVI